MSDVIRSHTALHTRDYQGGYQQKGDREGRSGLLRYLVILLKLQSLADPLESPLVRQLGPLSPQSLLELLLTHL